MALDLAKRSYSGRFINSHSLKIEDSKIRGIKAPTPAFELISRRLNLETTKTHNGIH
jgi:hypothetical protein